MTQRRQRSMGGLGGSFGRRGAPLAVHQEAKWAAESIAVEARSPASNPLCCIKRKFWQGLSSMWYCDVTLLPQCQLSTARNWLARRLVPDPAGLFLP